MTENERFDCWAIVEAMGFKKYAGHVTTQELAGSSFIRVDVPQCVRHDDFAADATVPAFSKLIGAGCIYMITPTDEATARKAAAVLARDDDYDDEHDEDEEELLGIDEERTARIDP